MKKTLEGLWNEYLSDQCAELDTSEEKALTKKAIELHERATDLLNKEQETAVQKYVDALLEIETVFAKKAFFKGCEFAISFFLEAGNSEK